MRETKISIVVPVYNAEKELQRCVDSIFRQSFSNWELLLIDEAAGIALRPCVTGWGRRTQGSGSGTRKMAVSAVPEIWGSVRLKESIFFLRTVMIPCSRIPWQLYIKRQKYPARIFRCAVLHIWWNRRKNVWITFRKKLSRWRKRISGGAVFIGLPAGIFQSAME